MLLSDYPILGAETASARKRFSHTLSAQTIIKFNATTLRNVYVLEENLQHSSYLQIFPCLYEIFYSISGSNILQKDILTAIIKSKSNEIKA